MFLVNRFRTNFGAVVAVLLSLGAAGNTDARPYIIETFTEGDEWILNIDGDEAKLTLLGGQEKWLQGGAFKLTYDIDWGGQKGRLMGFADSDNTRQEVRLRLTRKNGIPIRCRGFIAQKSSNFIAGTCEDQASGAFYATAIGSGPHAAPLRAAVNPSELTAQNLINDLIDAKALIDEKADQAQNAGFPKGPKNGSKLKKWLEAHNKALLNVVMDMLEPGDRNAYKSLENDKCKDKGKGKGIIFCKADYRQLAIACGLGMQCW